MAEEKEDMERQVLRHELLPTPCSGVVVPQFSTRRVACFVRDMYLDLNGPPWVF